MREKLNHIAQQGRQAAEHVAVQIAEQSRQAAKEGREASAIAYHGIAAARHASGREHAGAVIERMDHKNALYSDLGALAVTGKRTETPVARGDVAMPRTAVEKFVDYRIDRRSKRKQTADTYAYRARQIYGPDKSRRVITTRKALTDTALRPLGEPRPQTGIFRTAARNIERAILGPKISGKTKLARRLAHLNNILELTVGRKVVLEEPTTVNDATKLRLAKSRKSFREARLRSAEIEAEPVKLGNQAHKSTRNKKRRREELFDLAVQQPISSTWRNSKQRRAINRATKHHQRLEAHRRALEELRAKRAAQIH